MHTTPGEQPVRVLATRANLLTYLGGGALVSLWTLLRFANQPSTYDLTTQQVLAHSWLHGFHGPVSLGTTNYLLKLIALYMPADLLPGSPRLKLILVTLLINLVTFALLYVILKRLLEAFAVPVGHAYNAAFLWLAAIAGSVFWISYANSRNLEVAGGMLLVLLVVQYLQKPSGIRLGWLVLFAGLLFFADQLQVFMVGLPLVMYASILAMRRRLHIRAVASLGLALLAGLALAIAAAHIVYPLLHITISDTAAGSSLSVSSVLHSIPAAARALVRQFSGGFDAGHGRLAINLVILAIGTALCVIDVARKLIPRRLMMLVLTFCAVDVVVYILSGKAQQSDTSRYLVMLGPVAVLALASALAHIKATALYLITSLFVLVNITGLGWALHAATHTAPDARLASASAYVRANPGVAAYASMDTATPLAYYEPHLPIFPLACNGTKLQRAVAFRDNRHITAASPNAKIAIILDGTAIRNTPNVCTAAAIAAQFGAPLHVDQLRDHSLVYVYRAASLKFR